MSVSTVWGLKIYLREEHTQDTDIGLYTAGGVSWFRWIENSIAGTSVTYKAGIISAGGIPDIVEGGSFERGGAFVNVEPITVMLCNTSKFYADLDSAGIGINGLRCELIEFVLDTDVGSTTETVKGYFKTSVDSWSIANYMLPLEPAVYNRNAPMGTLVDIQAFPNASGDDIGKMIPMTFGEFKNDKYAKMERTTKLETVLDSNAITAYLREKSGQDMTIIDPDGIATFPVVGTAASPSLAYTIQMGIWGQWNATDPIVPTDLYIKITQHNPSGGAADVTGQYRKITELSFLTDPVLRPYKLVIAISDYFESDLVADTSGNGTWLSIVRIEMKYNLDAWKCGGFLESSLWGVLSTGAELYEYNNRQTVTSGAEGDVVEVKKTGFDYFRLASFAQDIVYGDTELNSISIRPLLSSGNIDSCIGFIIIPLNYKATVSESKILYPFTESNLATWGLTGYTKQFDGLYYGTAAAMRSSISAPSWSDVLKAFDKDNTTEAVFTVDYHPGGNLDYMAAFELRLPDCPLDSFSGAYLGIEINNKIDPAHSGAFTNGGQILIKKRKFLGTSEHVLPTAIGETYAIGKPLEPSDICTLPDFYFTTGLNTNNIWFFVHSDVPPISGYKQCDLLAPTPEEYHNIYKVGIFIKRHVNLTDASSNVDTIKFFELAVMFEVPCTYGNSLLTFANGRIFNNTWASRKTAASVMTSPLDYYEHACRLQNWDEAKVSGDTEIEYGKEYSTRALINTTLFDGSRLNNVRNLQYTFQVTDYEKSWTKIFKEHLLSSMWCVGYVDEDGKECINFIPKVSGDAITDTITLADVPDGMSPGEVQEPKPENVFCEPFIRYNWNEGAQRFDGLIAIKQSHRPTWGAAYTPGFDGGEGSAMWQFCHDELWTRYHQIEDPPSSLTDQPFINRAEDAKWFLSTWLDWMLVRRITIPVYYAKAASWHVGRHVYINFPHQTDGDPFEAVVEKIVKDKSAGVCYVSVAFWVETPVQYYIQEVMYTVAGGADADWVETMTVAGDSTDKTEGM